METGVLRQQQVAQQAAVLAGARMLHAAVRLASLDLEALAEYCGGDRADCCDVPGAAKLVRKERRPSSASR